MAGDAGRHIDLRAGVERQADFTRAHLHRAGNRQRERCAAQLHRADAQRQMMHDRVADQHRLDNVRRRCADFFSRLRGQGVDRLAHGLGQRCLAALIHHDIGDPRHQVFAKADLWVGGANRGQRAPGQQIDQMSGNGGRADIDGQAQKLVVQAGPQRGDECWLVRAIDRRCHLPVTLAQSGLKGGQEAGV